MSITNSIIGIDIDNVELGNLQNFFLVENEESDIFELKSFVEKGQNNYKEKEKGVLKTICGFLNSNGGLLIWGSPAGHVPEGRTEKIFTGELSPVDRNFEKDAFIGKVTNRITPTPTGIRFKKTKVADNQFVYLIEVPESKTKPHQFDNRYYMRLDGQTKVAPHHYVEALFKQIRYPELGGYLKFGEMTSGKEGSLYLEIKVFIFNHSPLQNEEDVSFNLTINKGIFHNYKNRTADKRLSFRLAGSQLVLTDFAPILHYGSPRYHSELVTINPADLVNDNRIKFFLHFGGKHSPMRVSEYTMEFNNVLFENTTPLISSKKENVLLYEIGKDKGEEMEKVNKILGR